MFKCPCKLSGTAEHVRGLIYLMHVERECAYWLGDLEKQ